MGAITYSVGIEAVAESGACPSCSRARDAGPECPHCGIIYERFRPRLDPTALKPVPIEAKPERRYLNPRAQEQLFVSLSQALDAGMTVQQFARGPGGELLPAKLRNALGSQGDTEATVGEVLAQHIRLDQHSVALLGAGQKQGELPRALRVLARRSSEQQAAHRLLVKTLIYPSILIVSAILLPPIPTIVIEGPGAYLSAIAMPLALVVGLGVFIFGVRPRLDPHGSARRSMRRITAWIPPFMFIQRHRAVAAFADTLGASVGAGLPITESLALAVAASGHPSFEDQQETVDRSIRSGSSLADALQAVSILSSEDRALVGHGELVGKLDEVLPRVAEHHNQKARTLTITSIVIGAAIVLAAVMLRMALSIIGVWTDYFETIESQLGLFG